MCLSYLGFFSVRVIMFVILKKFTINFTIKSVVLNGTVEIIGLSTKGNEIFRYTILNNDF